MHVDLSAVPVLCNSPVVAGSGVGFTEAQWAVEIDKLRPRVLCLSYRELCNAIGQMEVGDLTVLVINQPFSHAVLTKLQTGLSKPVAEMLAEDCANYGERLIGPDLAFGVVKRVNAVLDETEENRATPDQIQQLQPLIQQLASLENLDWYDAEGGIPFRTLIGAINLLGGVTSNLGQRVQQLASPMVWEMMYLEAIEANEPLSRQSAHDAIVGIPELLAGRPWPVDDEV